MLNLYKSYAEQFGGNDMTKLMVLNIGIRLYPVLCDYGCALSGPLAIVVEEERMIQPIVEVLRGYAKPLILPLGTKKKDLIEKLKANEYELFTLYCQNKNERNIENLSILKNVMYTRKVEQSVFDSVIVVFFIRGIPPELEDFFAGKVIFDKATIGHIRQDSEYMRKFYERIIRYLPGIPILIRKKYRSNVPFLNATIGVMNALLEDEVMNEEDARFVCSVNTYVELIKNNWQISNEYVEWFEILRELMLDEGTEMSGSVERTKLTGLDKLPTFDVLVYDHKFYYIPEFIFTNACKKISYYVSSCEMKHAMAEAGILYREGVSRNYYSARIPISTAKGIQFLQRRMKILREWMDRPGELSWHELVNIRGGKLND